MHIVGKHLYPDVPIEPIRLAAEQELLPLFKAVRPKFTPHLTSERQHSVGEVILQFQN